MHTDFFSPPGEGARVRIYKKQPDGYLLSPRTMYTLEVGHVTSNMLHGRYEYSYWCARGPRPFVVGEREVGTLPTHLRGHTSQQAPCSI